MSAPSFPIRARRRAVVAAVLAVLGAAADARAQDSSAVGTTSPSPVHAYRLAPAGATPATPATSADTVVPRPHAVEYSEAYGRRLTIHRWGSYVMLPLFVGQYILGDKLLQQKEDVFSGARAEPVDSDLRSWHAVTAGAVGALFVVNTTTGVWNLIEARHDPNGRGRRTAHVVTMLLADAGFVATGFLGGDATDGNPDDARRHRNMALASMSVAAVGAAIMWLRRD